MCTQPTVKALSCPLTPLTFPTSPTTDTIRLVRCTDPSCSTFERVRQTGSDISWESDRKTKFSNPPVAAGQDLCDAFVGVKVRRTAPASHTKGMQGGLRCLLLLQSGLVSYFGSR